MSEKRAVHIRIEGRVQGVGYRWWFSCEARRFKMQGWVRNRHDGTVEAWVQGLESDVADLLERCFAGPPSSRVTDVVVTAQSPDPEVSDFRRLPTL